MNLINKEKSSTLSKLLIWTCIASNLSQMPYLVNLGLTQYLNMPLWIVVLVYILFHCKRITNTMVNIYLMMGIVLAGSLLFTIITGGEYIYSSMFICLLLSIFIYSSGSFSSKSINILDLKNIMVAYAMSAFIVSVCIYIEYFSGNIDLSSSVYAYSSKNSISQILFTAIFILGLIKFEETRLMKVFRLFAIGFMCFLLLLLRSRATILGFLVCLVYLAIQKNSSRKLKLYLVAALVLGCFSLIVNEHLYEIVINNLLFASRDFTDINALSSGRLAILQSFPTLIDGNWITGIGNIYFECFPASAILNFGVFIGIIVLFIAYYPGLYAFMHRNCSEYHSVFWIICIGYMINSVFEGLAPIGPGVKCYFMWLLFGVLSGNKCTIVKR